MRDAKIKVLIVTTLFPSEEKPYYCIYLLQLFDAIKRYGYAVDVLMPNSALPDGEIVEKQYRDFNLIHVGFSNRLPHEILGKTSRSFAGSVLEILKTKKPDIIDFNFGSIATGKCIISIAKKLGIPTVMHFHGLNVFSDYKTAHPLLEKVLARNKLWNVDHADGVVGVSDKVVQIVRKKSKNKAVYTVYNGVDAGLFYPPAERNNDIFSVICVGNLIPIKGQEFLIRAVHNVIYKHGHNVRVQIVGDGPEKDNLQKLSAELGVADAVEFLGERNYEVVAQKVREADFFIMPSYFEALGCVYLEAMASRVAVMGVKGCGIDEVIEDKKNGYIVSPRSEEQIEEGILFALENPEEHSKIAQRGYETVVNGYLWEHAAGELDKVYRELLDRRKNHA